MARLGELLTQQQLVDQQIIDQALKLQVGGNRRLGHILVKMKAITDDQLAETLSGQLGISICDIDASFNQDAAKTIPRYLCNEYGVLPLSLKANNVLQIAMGNPSDDEAINDLEHFTGMVIEPTLAKQSEIDREIPRRIPLSYRDFISPRATTTMAKVGVAVSLILVVLVGNFTYRYVQNAKYGTKSVTSNSTIYKNHDLMLGFDRSGKINLLGHGAYAKGYYSVSFTNPEVFYAFLKSRSEDLSEKQRDWLDWALTQEDVMTSADTLAANN